MTDSEKRRLGDLEAQMEREDPEFARSLADGRPRSPREYRRGRAWLVLAVAVGCLGFGIGIGHGLLLATGLVVAGIAGHLFDPQRRRPQGPGPDIG
ncbi:hypothetical protein DSC45_21430 [Streptomyces sp. YIM 130001]|uniref:DUF3040 domain-containing protein n=1 Tax=Streptomyces sp. YIM 130001 TaxID=2259644 RepID=UPI000E655B33|nr:DUF3040 domain-containing protein [Streptomyces sp. YIM 130001]RII14253.1 hypothetical protein DSC45_21430 [Streptomyces sp. YIM 130001]